ncbi:T9SS-dependent choice-of-anchor J family protein [Hymenobacter sp. BT491]|uniref:T9SS-dependent choice-of-anchor J family protein n=1 Tax=Hymenobacter sp. BT491 TaxID=2766779 RepID=UPI00165366A1|nr:choice-of-anchor J domain-containing protein [Hymenobacter sp. BT491]MBC6992436.1 choice-of-anchor J domain-containing protein [Hymenobacter sp. BT491]
MKHTYATGALRTAKSGWWSALRLTGLTALLATVLGAFTAQAQDLNYNEYSVQIAQGTYTDLAATGTAITTTSTDDANSAAQPIGFTFNYNGAAFTQFVLNTNGYLRLGSQNPSAASYFNGAENYGGGPLNSADAADVNLLLPFNVDLVAGASPAEYRVATTGTAPNRICTIQWKNVSDKSRDGVVAKYTNFSFQAKLYEGTNVIEFVYDVPTAASIAANQDFFKAAAVGIKGSGKAANQAVVLQKSSAQDWTEATALGRNYSGPDENRFNFRASTRPAAGTTYRFTPGLPRDGGITAIYTLGRISPEALPHTVKAAVINFGTAAFANATATLQVTGANTFTSSKTFSLARGEVREVVFDPYPATLNPGTNTLTVTLTSDDENSDNKLTTSQVVTTNQILYTDPTKDLQGGLTYGAASGQLAAKFVINQPTTVSAITARFKDVAGNTAAYRFLLYDATGPNGTPGKTLYTSDVQTRTAAGGEVTLPVPNVLVNSPFYVAIAEQTGASSGIGYQIEFPLRKATYYANDLNNGGWDEFGDVGLEGAQLALGVTFGAAPACGAPINVSLSNITATSAAVNFTPTSGTGPYVVEYGPKGFALGTGTTVAGTTSPIALPGLTAGTTYDVYVRKNCGGTAGTSANNGPYALTTACQAASTVPYAENFDARTAPALPCGVTVLDANNDQFGWEVAQIQGTPSTPNSIVYSYNSLDPAIGADDWFFTPALSLSALQQYTVSFKYRVGAFNNGPAIPEGLEIRYGTSPTVAGMPAANTIYTSTTLAAQTFTAVNSQPLRPTANGQYYIGFHAISPGDAFFLAIDDIAITPTVLSVNTALSRAINAYPNPTTGRLTIDLGATSARKVQAAVVNSLGQVVYTRTLTGKQDQLDLSALAAGIYTLKLDIDGETAVKRIAVQK